MSAPATPLLPLTTLKEIMMENKEVEPCCADHENAETESQVLDEAKKRAILAQFGYRRPTPGEDCAEQGACGKTRRRTCC